MTHVPAQVRFENEQADSGLFSSTVGGWLNKQKRGCDTPGSRACRPYVMSYQASLGSYAEAHAPKRSCAPAG